MKKEELVKSQEPCHPHPNPLPSRERGRRDESASPVKGGGKKNERDISHQGEDKKDRFFSRNDNLR